MKRLSVEINETTITYELVDQCLDDAAENKKGREDVKHIFDNRQFYVSLVRASLINGDFKASPYNYKTIMDGDKERNLTIPKFYPDQIVHHVLIKLIEERLYQIMDPLSGSSIPDRGIHYLKDRLQRFMTEHYKYSTYCLKADIEKCFPSITPDVAFNAVKKYFKGDLFLKYVEDILCMSNCGLALGNYMSAWILNVVLIGMDHAIRNSYYTSHYKDENGKKAKRRIKIARFYCRYMDDIVILGNNKEKLEANTLKFMKKELRAIGLKLKFHIIFNTSERPIDFVGFKFRHEKSYDPKDKSKHALHTGLRKSTFIKLVEQIKEVQKSSKVPDLATIRSLVSRLGVLKHFNSYKLVEKYDIEPLINTLTSIISMYDKNVSIHEIQLEWILYRLNSLVKSSKLNLNQF